MGLVRVTTPLGHPQGETLDLAINGAAEKLNHALSHVLDKLNRH
ncbi:hypothetical protein [Stutzerimonas xanthomarina]